MLSEPPPYHVKVRDYFKKQSGVWSFFSMHREKGGSADRGIGNAADRDTGNTADPKMDEEDWEIVEKIMQALASHPERDAALQETVRRFRAGEKLIEGPMELDRLDLLEQKELRERTGTLLHAYLHPEWFRTPGVMGLARAYFADWDTGARVGTDAGTDATAGNEWEAGEKEMILAGAHASIQEYFSYVLLDFVLAAPELGNAPLEHARQWARALDIASIFETILQKEMIYPYDDHREDTL